MGRSDIETTVSDDVLSASDSACAAEGGAQGILVLGMHRSGTSLTAAVLAAMGAFAGDEAELLPAHPRDNPAGYWERNELMLAQDAFLRATGHAWDRIGGFDVSSTESSEARRTLEKHVRDLVASLRSRHGPWQIKDPRLCLLLPLWEPILGEFAAVVAVRDPREIAASLRDTHRGVLTSVFPLALWEKYTRSLLAALRGRKVMFVSYHALLADPQAQIRRLREGLESLGVAGLKAAASLPVDRELHRSMPEAHIRLTEEQAALYAWLLEQTLAPGGVRVPAMPPSTTPDRLLTEFEAAFDFHIELGRHRARQETAEQLHRIETALAAHANEREHWHNELNRQHERALELTEKLSRASTAAALQARDFETARHSTTEEARSAARAYSAEIASLQQRIAELERSSSELRVHAVALSERERALRASASWKITAPLRGIAALFSTRGPMRGEQSLYRLYYATPGLSAARKRALILWVHRNLPWLTRHTLSYRLYRETQDLIHQRTTDPELRKKLQRMDAQRAAPLIASMDDPPLISIVMPVYNVDADLLRQAVESVRAQFYPHWELCIVDDASTRRETRAALDAIALLGDARIKLRRLERNIGIAGASNAALELASGAFVGLLDHDDVLTRDALLEVVLRIKSDDADLIYSDEDKLDENGINVEPHFKPDYNEDYLFSINYLCHFSVIRRNVLQEIGGFRSGFDGAQDYDLLLRVTERTPRIAHIPKVLYHWRRSANSTAQNAAAKPQTSEAGRRALAESLQRRGIDAQVLPGPFPNTYRVRRTLRGTPLISILIPFRDKASLLETCIESILRDTTYANFEILGIDNGSIEPATQRALAALAARDARVRFVRYDAAFNYSAINNFGAKHARGEHLLFLNNDTEVLEPGWLEAMLAHSQRPDVGVVGAKLLYADDTLQHSGVIVGIGGVAGHAHLFLPADAPGYFSRAQLTQDLSAVTFACAMTRREVFEKLGGLNENELRIAFNDVDYCLRVREAGYLIVYTPDAVLHHYESKSRGYEDTPEKQTRFAGEIRYMQQRHGAVLRAGDPYYNPNLSLTHCYQPDPGYADALPL